LASLIQHLSLLSQYSFVTGPEPEPPTLGTFLLRPGNVAHPTRSCRIKRASNAKGSRTNAWTFGKKNVRRSERESFDSELYQITLAYRASCAELLTCFDAEADRCPFGPAATCNSEDDSESSVSSPAKAHAASGTRDLTGIPPIVFLMAFSLRRPTPC
jgi:hypothetical protein